MPNSPRRERLLGYSEGNDLIFSGGTGSGKRILGVIGGGAARSQPSFLSFSLPSSHRRKRADDSFLFRCFYSSGELLPVT